MTEVILTSVIMCSGQEDMAETTEIVSHSKCGGKAMFGRLDAA